MAFEDGIRTGHVRDCLPGQAWPPSSTSAQEYPPLSSVDSPVDGHRILLDTYGSQNDVFGNMVAGVHQHASPYNLGALDPTLAYTNPHTIHTGEPIPWADPEATTAPPHCFNVAAYSATGGAGGGFDDLTWSSESVQGLPTMDGEQHLHYLEPRSNHQQHHHDAPTPPPNGKDAKRRRGAGNSKSTPQKINTKQASMRHNSNPSSRSGGADVNQLSTPITPVSMPRSSISPSQGGKRPQTPATHQQQATPPQAGPAPVNDKPHGSKTTRRGSQASSNGNANNTNDSRKAQLERNRLAANRCRAKRKVASGELQEKEMIESVRNSALHRQKQQLETAVLQGRRLLLEHARCGNDNIDRYIADAARLIAAGLPVHDRRSSEVSASGSAASGTTSGTASGVESFVVSDEEGDEE